jgi:hypothetical protein
MNRQGAQDPDFLEPDTTEPAAQRRSGTSPERPLDLVPRRAPRLLGIGTQLAWLAGLVLALSSFMGWYSGSGEGPTIAVIGWHTGVLGKLVFFIGLAVVVLAIAREAGAELPPSVPESLIVVALGTIATIFVLIRLISIPDTFADTAGRGIGIWISLLAGLGVILGGLARAAEEL